MPDDEYAFATCAISAGASAYAKCLTVAAGVMASLLILLADEPYRLVGAFGGRPVASGARHVTAFIAIG
jgi:hypothetical protein